MRRVYKYPLVLDLMDTNDGNFTLPLPKGADIIHFAEQHGGFEVWAVVDTEVHTTEPRHLFFAGTGHDLPPEGELVHVASVLVDQGTFVFHLFEVKA